MLFKLSVFISTLNYNVGKVLINLFDCNNLLGGFCKAENNAIKIASSCMIHSMKGVCSGDKFQT